MVGLKSGLSIVGMLLGTQLGLSGVPTPAWIHSSLPPLQHLPTSRAQLVEGLLRGPWLGVATLGVSALAHSLLPSEGEARPELPIALQLGVPTLLACFTSGSFLPVLSRLQEAWHPHDPPVDWQILALFGAVAVPSVAWSFLPPSGLGLALVAAYQAAAILVIRFALRRAYVLDEGTAKGSPRPPSPPATLPSPPT